MPFRYHEGGRAGPFGGGGVPSGSPSRRVSPELRVPTGQAPLSIPHLISLQGAVGNRATCALLQHSESLGLPAVQRVHLERGKLNVAGEEHSDSKKRRTSEAEYAKQMTGGGYWQEGTFRPKGSTGAQLFGWTGFTTNPQLGDPMSMRVEHLLAMVKSGDLRTMEDLSAGKMPVGFSGTDPNRLADVYRGARKDLRKSLKEICVAVRAALKEEAEARAALRMERTVDKIEEVLKLLNEPDVVDDDVGTDPLVRERVRGAAKAIASGLNEVIERFETDVMDGRSLDEPMAMFKRSMAMHRGATGSGQTGLWKVGDGHIRQIKAIWSSGDYKILTKEEFEEDYLPWHVKKYGPEKRSTRFRTPGTRIRTPPGEKIPPLTEEENSN